MRSGAQLALFGLLAIGAGGAAAQAVPSAGPGESVPFVAQTPLLCGGAAAAMVERFWGRRAVYAEDYSGHVRPDEGGILTGDLIGAMEARGLAVALHRNDPTAVLEAVASGVPALVLIESGEVRYHYVVLVGVGPDDVTFHDPNWGPSRTLPVDRLLEVWAPTDYWATVATPSGSWYGAGTGEDQASAPPPGPRIQQAADLLGAGRLDEAADLARTVLADAAREGEASGDVPDAWRVIATARYLGGDPDHALEAWNQAGEPRVDLVRVDGLRHVRYHALTGHLGLRPDTLLTAPALRRARRRLDQVEALAASRLHYEPLANGDVDVVVAALEQPRTPPPLAWLVSNGFRALIDREAAAGAGPFLAGAERWTVLGSWWNAQSRLAFRVSQPLAGSLFSVEGAWLRERALPGPAGVREATRLRGGAALERWVGGRVRMDAAVGLERWDGSDRMAALDAGVVFRTPSDRAGASVHTSAWAGDRSRVVRLGVRGRAELPGGIGGGAWRVVAGATVVSESAPFFLWEGAGSGRIRDPLLRGHSLILDDALSGAVFGQRLVHATVEWSLPVPLGPFDVRAGPFLDLAAARRDGVGSGLVADPGFEVRGGVLGRGIAVSVAHGDDGWRVSARTSPDLRWPGS